MNSVPSTLSVLVISWNNREFIGRALESLPADAEIVVVDNGSTDGSPEEALRLRPNARVERLGRNLGFAAATNIGAALATGTYLLLLDADAEATPGAIDRLIAHLDAHSAAGAAAGRLLSMTEEPQPDAIRRLPTLASIAADLLLVSRFWPSNPVSRRATATDLDRSLAADVEHASATCLMVRREAFDRIGGFDPQFAPAWFEDVDFCHRLQDAGYRIAYVPSAAFRHVGGTSARALGSYEATRVYFRNLERYVHKHHGVTGLLFVKALLVLGMVLRVVGSAARADRLGMRAFSRVLSGTLRGWRHA